MASSKDRPEINDQVIFRRLPLVKSTGRDTNWLRTHVSLDARPAHKWCSPEPLFCVNVLLRLHGDFVLIRLPDVWTWKLNAGQYAKDGNCEISFKLAVLLTGTV